MNRRHLAAALFTVFTICVAHAQGSAAAPPVYTAGEFRGTTQQGGRHYAHIKVAPGQKIPFSTLTYRLESPQQVAKLRHGDRVQFRAERVGGENVLREIR